MGSDDGKASEWIAQRVEHRDITTSVAGSIPAPVIGLPSNGLRRA